MFSRNIPHNNFIAGLSTFFPTVTPSSEITSIKIIIMGRHYVPYDALYISTILRAKTIIVCVFGEEGNQHTKRLNHCFPVSHCGQHRLKSKLSWCSFETKKKHFPFHHSLFHVNLMCFALIFLRQIIITKYSLMLPVV